MALVFLIVLFSLNIPFVQTQLAHRLTHYINTELGTNIKIDRVSITFDFKVNAKGVYIADHHQDTLIASASLKTSLINIPGIVEGRTIDFGSVTADHLTFRLHRYLDDDKDSFGIFLDKLENKNPKDVPTIVNFSHITVIDGKFSFVDHQGRYPEIVNLDSLNLDVSNFVIQGSAIDVDINRISGLEKRGIKLESLSTNFKLRKGLMNFDNFNLVTSKSHLKGQIHFSYEDTMRDFENHVHVAAHFEDARLSTSDLKKYYDPFGSGQILRFHGDMDGVLNDFELHNLEFYGMQKTRLIGALRIQNIFGNGRFRMAGNFGLLETNYKDLIRVMPGHLLYTLPEYLEKIGTPRLEGYLATAGGDMVEVRGHITSEVGVADVDVELNNLTERGEETYTGKLALKEFDFGELLNNPNVGKADFDFQVDGKGFSSEQIKTDLKGKFSSLVFKGYTYRNIEVNGALNAPVFTGQVVSHDPNLEMSFDGMADVSGQDTNYDFNAHIDHFDLYKTQFIKKDSTVAFQGDVEIKMKGHNIDDLVGDLVLKNATFTNRKGDYKFGQLHMNSSFQGPIRRITVNSPDIVNGELKGFFYMRQIPDLVKNAVGSLYSQYTPIDIERDQYFNFDVVIHNKIVEALFPAISLSPNTTFMGRIRSGDSNVKVNFRSPEIKILNSSFKNVDFTVDNTQPSSNTSLRVDQFISKAYQISNLRLTSRRKNDTLLLQAHMKGGKKNEDELNLRLFHTIGENNAFVFGLRPSRLHYKDEDWFLNRQNQKQEIVFGEDFKTITMDTLTLEKGNERIGFTGKKKNSKNQNYKLDFSNVDLSEVIPEIERMEFAGIVNGGVKIVQKDGIFYPESDLRIHQLEVNGISYGRLGVDITGNSSLTSYSVEALLQNGGIGHLRAQGKINVSKIQPTIDVGVQMNDFDIGFLNTFGKEVINHIRGQATGVVKISGSLRHPSFDGGFELNDGGLTIPYLNVDMALEDQAQVRLEKQEFQFVDVDFEDTKFHTQGFVNGVLSHHNFKDWEMDLNLTAPDRLLVLNTDYTEDALYYGTAFISGTARFHGPFDELVIDASASSEKGTEFIIPLSDSEAIADNDYIYFLTADDKEAKEEGKGVFVRQLKGLEMNFDLDINENAEIEIVVDQKTGSKLRGKGNGTLVMDINTTGRFNMWGEFQVTKGIYDFRYAGLIAKEFTVEPGGSVTWDGNPLQANLNVRAVYHAEANPASLLENPTLNRNIPIDVYTELTGPLSNVEVNFELEYPNLSSVVKSELQYRISDRKTTELQALSLITQNSFYDETGPGRAAHPENILFERATGIFNDILASEDDVFQVGVDYTKGNRTPDQDISDRVGVTLSTNVSDRILINGKLGVPLGGLTRSVVVGDVEIEILLNASGTLRAKIFNRESDIQYIGEELGYTQGVGLTYSVDFDSFKELIHKVLHKAAEQENLEYQRKGNKASSLVPDYIKFP